MVAAEDGGTVGVGVAVRFDGVAEMGIAGGDEEGGHEVGITVGGWGGGAIEEVMDFLGVAFHLVFLFTEIGTEELEGHETGCIVCILDEDMGIGGEAFQSKTVVLCHLFCIFLCIAMTEDVDDFFLVVRDGIATEQFAPGFVFELDITHVDVLEVDAFRPVEDVDADGDVGLTVLDVDGLDDGTFTFPGVHLKCHGIPDREFCDGLVEEEGQMMVLQDFDEILHLCIRYRHLLPIRVTIVVQLQSGFPVPVGLHNLLHPILRCLNEHKVMEVTAKAIRVFDGVIIPVIAVLIMVVPRQQGHVMIGDIESVGWQRGCIRCEEESLAVLLQHAFNPCGIEMAQDVPWQCLIFTFFDVVLHDIRLSLALTSFLVGPFIQFESSLTLGLPHPCGVPGNLTRGGFRPTAGSPVSGTARTLESAKLKMETGSGKDLRIQKERELSLCPSVT